MTLKFSDPGSSISYSQINKTLYDNATGNQLLSASGAMFRKQRATYDATPSLVVPTAQGGANFGLGGMRDKVPKWKDGQWDTYTKIAMPFTRSSLKDFKSSTSWTNLGTAPTFDTGTFRWKNGVTGYGDSAYTCREDFYTSALKCYSAGSNANSCIRYDDNGSQHLKIRNTTVYNVSFWFMLPSLPATNAITLFTAYGADGASNSADGIQVRLYINTSGYPVYNAYSSSTLQTYTFGGNAVVANRWYFAELKGDGSQSSATVYFTTSSGEGSTAYTLTNTTNPRYWALGLFISTGYTAANTVYFQDLRIVNGSNLSPWSTTRDGSHGNAHGPIGTYVSY